MKPLVNYGYANICFAHFLFSGMCSLEGENKGGGAGGSQTGHIRFISNLKGVKCRAGGRDTLLRIVGNHLASDAALHPWRPEF